ncbi:hypothetical protein AB1Y20_010526 [Prymnesium parvum]|uniref:Uncharacterized protein n=1 Tax=Prymnesium parvum TaxID=97485 RepID=A0AB34IRR0_PRYPA|mmetsp:Transcript_4414/g.11011  ORF Transcript_4414/g.11011 Transcript_4414/m.11011 type:complete len:502 (-) Transcript_4414:152-1657(-)
MNLSVDGRGDKGINIDDDTTLASVRKQFPVPAEYVFGVPVAMEDSLLAGDFIPLQLLKVKDMNAGTIYAKPINDNPAVVALKRELDELKRTLQSVESRRQAEETESTEAIARFMRERDALARDLSTARAEHEKTRRALRELVPSVRARSAQLKPELDALASLVRGLQSVHSEQTNELVAMVVEGHERARLREDLQSLTRERDARAAESRALDEAIKRKTVDLAQLEEECRDARAHSPVAPPSVRVQEYAEVKRGVEELASAAREFVVNPGDAGAQEFFAQALDQLQVHTAQLQPHTSRLRRRRSTEGSEPSDGSRDVSFKRDARRPSGVLEAEARSARGTNAAFAPCEEPSSSFKREARAPDADARSPGTESRSLGASFKQSVNIEAEASLPSQREPRAVGKEHSSGRSVKSDSRKEDSDSRPASRGVMFHSTLSMKSVPSHGIMSLRGEALAPTVLLTPTGRRGAGGVGFEPGHSPQKTSLNPVVNRRLSRPIMGAGFRK